MDFVEDRTMDRSSALTAARELDGFRLSPATPDVRGWSVLACDGRIAGQVARLFVDVKSRKVRYLEVVLDGSRQHAGLLDRHAVLVPVGVARRVDDARAVLVELAVEVLTRAPRIPMRAVTRDDEDATLSAYGLPVAQGVSDFERYESAHFDEAGLLTPGRRNTPRSSAVIMRDESRAAPPDRERAEFMIRRFRQLEQNRAANGGDARAPHAGQREAR
jgi:hypothetical protein